MKNSPISFILSILALFAVLVTVISCKKDQPPFGISGYQSSRQLKIVRLIENFKSQIRFISENPAYKSSEALSPDSALWYLEATINYSHTFPNDLYFQTRMDTVLLTIPVNAEGGIGLNDLVTKYDEMKTSVSNLYHQSDFQQKGLISVDLNMQPESGQNEVTIEVVSVVGDKTGNNPPGYGIDGPFVEGDDWWYGEFAGHCDPHTWDSDAAHELMTAMNNYIPDPNGNYIFVNLFQIELKGGSTEIRRIGDPNPPDNQFDYYLFDVSELNGTITDEILCLSYPEMNLYFSFLKYLLFTRLPQEMPENYAIVRVLSMVGTFDWEVNTGYKHYYHQGVFQFGEKIYIASNSQEL